MKFSKQFSLIHISVQFVDAPDWTSPSWVIAKTLIFPYGFSLGRSIYRRFPKKLFYQSRIKSHFLYTIRYRILGTTKWCIIYKQIRSLSYLYGKHKYAEDGSNVVNGLIGPKWGLYLPITDILLRGFLARRTQICTPFA